MLTNFKREINFCWSTTYHGYGVFCAVVGVFPVMGFYGRSYFDFDCDFFVLSDWHFDALSDCDFETGLGIDWDFDYVYELDVALDLVEFQMETELTIG